MAKSLIKQVSAANFVGKAAKELEMIKEMEMPSWAEFVKTGTHRKFPPHRNDWWYVRSASVLRRIYIDGPVGVSRLRTYYGGRKERGHKPEKTVKAGGSVVRHILQKLEATGFVQKDKKGGRIITDKGNEFVRKIIGEVKK